MRAVGIIVSHIIWVTILIVAVVAYSQPKYICEYHVYNKRTGETQIIVSKEPRKKCPAYESPNQYEYWRVVPKEIK